MNTWLKNSTRGASAVVFFCLFCLFVDGIDLTDLLPDSTTVHFDEAGPAPDETGYSASVSPGQHTSGPLAIRHNAPGNALKLRRVFFDQDSPSLAPEPIIHMFLFFPREPEEKQPNRPVLPAGSLYLENRTLLL